MSTDPTPSSAQSIWFDSNLVDGVTAKWFDPLHWQEKALITGQAAGRGTTVFFRFAGLDMVLRHFRRGGLIGKLLTDQYFFTGLEKTRAWRELKLLLKMQDYELPAPRPVAAMVQKTLFYYRADIITQRIPNAQDVHHILLSKEIDKSLWRKIGATIKRFHALQIYHHDLNIHNIMLDEVKQPWLIDFDKCEQRNGESWKQQNLQRLQRSLEKEKTLNSIYHFEDAHWQALLEGYAQKAD